MTGVAAAPPFALHKTVINSFTGSANDDPSYVLSLAGDPAGRMAAVAGSEFDLKLYDRATLSPIGSAGSPAHEGRINEVCFGSTALPLLYSASSDGTLRGWDCSAGSATAPALTLRDRRDEVFCVSASVGQARKGNAPLEYNSMAADSTSVL